MINCIIFVIFFCENRCSKTRMLCKLLTGIVYRVKSSNVVWGMKEEKTLSSIEIKTTFWNYFIAQNALSLVIRYQVLVLLALAASVLRKKRKTISPRLNW